jgi:hypothetical protein
MKESTTTSALPTTTLHHDGELTHASFAYTSSTNALPKTTMHHDENPMHVSFPSITSAKTKHCTMKESLHILGFLLAQSQVHCQKQHCIVKEI